MKKKHKQKIKDLHLEVASLGLKLAETNKLLNMVVDVIIFDGDLDKDKDQKDLINKLKKYKLDKIAKKAASDISKSIAEAMHNRFRCHQVPIVNEDMAQQMKQVHEEEKISFPSVSMKCLYVDPAFKESILGTSVKQCTWDPENKQVKVEEIDLVGDGSMVVSESGDMTLGPNGTKINIKK